MVDFIFPTAGTYEFNLQAVDATGLVSTLASRVIAVTAAGPASRSPTAAFTLSDERQVHATVSIDLSLADSDGDYAYANLWVLIPGQGWRPSRPTVRSPSPAPSTRPIRSRPAPGAIAAPSPSR